MKVSSLHLALKQNKVTMQLEAELQEHIFSDRSKTRGTARNFANWI